jgi:hypothetical protein
MQTLEAAPGTYTPTPRRLRPRIIACSILVVLIALAGWYLADRFWPYRYRNVKPLLESVLASQVTVREYRRTYFPYPGFVAEGLVLRRNSAPNLPPVGTTGKLIVRGSWLDLLLLRDRVRLVDLVGLHIVIPPVGSAANQEDFPPGSSADFAGPQALVQELRIHHGQLDIQRVDGGVYSYPIENLVIRNLQRGRTIGYTVDMRSVMPSGHILSSGSFGPLNPGDLGGTSLSGDFAFTQIKLSDIGKLHGQLDISDHFSGTLRAVQASINASTPDFAVSRGRPTPLSASADLTINGLNGNIALNAIELKTGASTIHSHGTIAGPANQSGPKTTNLDLTIANARLQDLMRPFMHRKVPVAGPVWISGHALVLPAQNGISFTKRLVVQAALQAPAEKSTKRSTEQNLTAFSQRASGAKSPPNAAEAPDTESDVLTSIAGHASIQDGIASSHDLRVQFPGASTTLTGTWNLDSTAAHFTGDLRMDTDISHVATGFKSLLLKPLAPFFKKGKAGAVIPIAITGTSPNYKVGQDLIGNK